MRWYDLYKFSQQTGLWGQDLQNDPPLSDQGNRQLFDPNTLSQVYSGGGIIADLENANNCGDVQYLARQYKAKIKSIDWPGGAEPVFVLEESNQHYVIECENGYVSVKPAAEWLSDISDLNLDSYVPAPSFNDEFWNGAGDGVKLYHGTDTDNIQSILKEGLSPRSETRGISNKWTGDAVFASFSPEGTSSYGDSVIEIDIGAMASAGYMPLVTQEEPIAEDQQRQSIAWKLGLRDYYMEDRSWEGLTEDTVVIHGEIPPQFLKLHK